MNEIKKSKRWSWQSFYTVYSWDSILILASSLKHLGLIWKKLWPHTLNTCANLIFHLHWFRLIYLRCSTNTLNGRQHPKKNEKITRKLIGDDIGCFTPWTTFRRNFAPFSWISSCYSFSLQHDLLTLTEPAPVACQPQRFLRTVDNWSGTVKVRCWNWADTNSEINCWRVMSCLMRMMMLKLAWMLSPKMRRRLRWRFHIEVKRKLLTWH